MKIHRCKQGESDRIGSAERLQGGDQGPTTRPTARRGLCRVGRSLCADLFHQTVGLAAGNQVILASFRFQSDKCQQRVQIYCCSWFVLQFGALSFAICCSLELKHAICSILELKYFTCIFHPCFYGFQWFVHSFHWFTWCLLIVTWCSLISPWVSFFFTYSPM